jgi:hypothetical protein
MLILTIECFDFGSRLLIGRDVGSASPQAPRKRLASAWVDAAQIGADRRIEAAQNRCCATNASSQRWSCRFTYQKTVPRPWAAARHLEGA